MEEVLTAVETNVDCDSGTEGIESNCKETGKVITQRRRATMKYRFIMPGAFLVVAILFLAVYIMGAGGHGPKPFDFVIYFMYPACLLTGLLDSFFGGPGLLWFLLCILASLFQYFLIGYVIDLGVRRYRKR